MENIETSNQNNIDKIYKGDYSTYIRTADGKTIIESKFLETPIETENTDLMTDLRKLLIDMAMDDVCSKHIKDYKDDYENLGYVNTTCKIASKYKDEKDINDINNFFTHLEFSEMGKDAKELYDDTIQLNINYPAENNSQYQEKLNEIINEINKLTREFNELDQNPKKNPQDYDDLITFHLVEIRKLEELKMKYDSQTIDEAINYLRTSIDLLKKKCKMFEDIKDLSSKLDR